MINRRIKGLTFRPRRTSSHIFNHISYFSHHIRNGDLFLPTMNSFVRPAHNSNHSFVKAASGIFCLVQWNLDLRKPNLRKNLDLRKIVAKVSFFGLCSKMQIISIKKLNIKTCFIQFLWFFRLKC